MASITIDIGNTRIKTALFSDGKLVEAGYFHHSGLEPMKRWLSRVSYERVIISSTADESVNVDSLLPTDIEPLYLSTKTPLPVRNEYRAESLGQDRIANSVAGHIHDPEASLVIDTGTCITYDWTIKGTYQGGSISPGLHMRAQAMHEFTGRLPLVEMYDTDVLIGKDTEESMRSGAYFGVIKEIEGIISLFKQRFPQGSVLITGGDSLPFADAIENDIFADPLLTLKGLYGILQFNNA